MNCFRYLNDTEDIAGTLCLVQVFSCVFTICDAMLLVALVRTLHSVRYRRAAIFVRFHLQTDWYAAVCFLIVVFGEITIYFLVGNLIELKVVFPTSWFMAQLIIASDFRLMSSTTQ